MLDQTSYIFALAAWTVSGLGVLLCLLRWSAGRLHPAWRCLLVLAAAALLLTPAYPDAETSTMAPAFVVAAFEGVFNSLEAAEHALRPLLFMLGLAPAVTFVLYLLLWRGRVSAKAGADEPERKTQ